MYLFVYSYGCILMYLEAVTNVIYVLFTFFLQIGFLTFDTFGALRVSYICHKTPYVCYTFVALRLLRNALRLLYVCSLAFVIRLLHLCYFYRLLICCAPTSPGLKYNLSETRTPIAHTNAARRQS